MQVLSFGSCCGARIFYGFGQDPDKNIYGSDHTGRETFMKAMYDASGGYNDGYKADRAYLAIITEKQFQEGYHGKKWLQIFRENGWEFIRSFSNSVHGTSRLAKKAGEGGAPYRLFLFGFFANRSAMSVKDAFLPPEGWAEMDGRSAPEAWEFVKDGPAVTKAQQEEQLNLFKIANAPPAEKKKVEKKNALKKMKAATADPFGRMKAPVRAR